MNHDHRVELNICTPHQPVRVISAKLSGHVSALQCLFPGQKKIFIFNGSFVNENSTFAELGLRSGDSIVALNPSSTKQDDLIQWISMTKDKEDFSDLVKQMLNPKTSAEASRLRDLHLMRMESNRRIYMKLKKPYIKCVHEGKCPCLNMKLSVLTNNDAIAPSTEALPILW